MIEAKDFDFHSHDSTIYNWTETLFTQFTAPDGAVSGSVYTLARPSMGVIHTSIEIHKGFCMNPWDADYADAQMHLPCPESHSRFTLKNGLTFETTNSPRDYRYKYRGEDNICSFDIECKGMMQPFDVHDPAENPLLEKATDSYSKTGYSGWSSGGHIESFVHSTGELVVRGRRYAINSVDGMNKSWGPRKDWGSKGTSWLHVSTGENFGIFLAMNMKFVEKELTYGPLRFGFILLDGEVNGVVKAEVKAQRVAMHAMRMIVRATDVRGKEYEAIGTAIAASPWYHFSPGSVSFQTLLRWECNGHLGYSSVGDFIGLNDLVQGMICKETP